MSGWIERQLQKLRTKEQEYRAWLRESFEGDVSGVSLGSGEIEVDSSPLHPSYYEGEENDDDSGESVSETASSKTNLQDDPSTAPRTAHRRVLIQRAGDLARRVATLDDAPSAELRRQAEQLANRLETYLQEAPELGSAEEERHSVEEDPFEKEDLDPAGDSDQEQSSRPDQEERREDPAATEGSDSDPDASSEIEQRICEAFIDWCNEAGAMVDRYYIFERRVREEHGDVEVTPIYQDTRASGVRLTYDADDVSSEFWLVEVGTHHLIFPQPRDAAHFRTLDPLFESIGDASPETLSDVRPAVVRLDGDSYLLESSGLVQ